MTAAVVIALALSAAACARAPVETRTFPVPQQAANPEAYCPAGWRFVNVERDAAGAVVRVVCRRVDGGDAG